MSSYFAYEASRRPVWSPDCLLGEPPITPGMAGLPTAEKAQIERYLILYERHCTE